MIGLEDLYREIILDHYRSPRNRGELESPPAYRVEGFNALCGDEVIVYILLDDAGLISDVAIGGQGCSISQSSASMMSEAIKGKTIEEARSLISAFKKLMSIHDEDSAAESTSESSSDEPSQEDPQEVKLGDLEALRGVVRFPIRIKCATLSWNALAQALEESEVS